MGKKIAIIASIIIALLLGVGVWWLFDSGRLVYSQNPGEQSGSRSSSAVCGNDLVSRYSDAATYTLREGSEGPSIDIKTLNELSSEVKAIDGYKDDPSCQSVLFQIAVLNDNYDEAKVAHEAVVRLHEAGRFPDSNILGNGTLAQHEKYLQGLTGFNGLTGLEDEYIE